MQKLNKKLISNYYFFPEAAISNNTQEMHKKGRQGQVKTAVVRKTNKQANK